GETAAPALSAHRRPPLPFATPRSPADREPPLTIEQYASLCVELARAPGNADEVLTRYGLDAASKKALDAAYEQRFADQPSLHAEWQRAYRAYEAWLRARG